MARIKGILSVKIIKYFVRKMTVGINKCSRYAPKSNERPNASWFFDHVELRY